MLSFNNNNNVNSPAFTSVVPVRFYQRNSSGVAELCKDSNIIEQGKRGVIKLLRGPSATQEQERLIRALAVRDPDYDYNMAKSGIFTRMINGIFKRRPPHEFLKFTSDEISDFHILFTGPQAIKLSVIGEKIGKITKKCMNLTAIRYNIPAENTLVKGKSAYKWSKQEKEFIKKHLINTQELTEEKQNYGQTILNALYNANLHLRETYNPIKHAREGKKIIFNFLLDNDNNIEKFNLSAYN